MQDRLARHFLPSEAVVLGTRLQPFSLWHWRTLAALRSPMVEGDSFPDFGDLALAVRVCALRPFGDLARALRVSWLGRLRLAVLRKTTDLEGEIDLWLEYFDYHSVGPRVKRRQDGGGRSVSVHACLYLACGLMARGIPEAETWTVTPGYARWKLAGMRESEGVELDIVTDRNIRDALEAGYSEEEIGD